MLGSAKSRTPEHWNRQIKKYEAKYRTASSPTQQNYARAKLSEARAGLRKSQNQDEPDPVDPRGTVSLHSGEYEVLD